MILSKFSSKDINSDNSDLKTKLHSFNIYENVALHGLLEPKKVHKLFAKSDISHFKIW